MHVAENDANLSGPRTTTLGGDDGQASGPVEAYEEDWYRSLKALAERRRELGGADDEPDGLESDDVPWAAIPSPSGDQTQGPSGSETPETSELPEPTGASSPSAATPPEEGEPRPPAPDGGTVRPDLPIPSEGSPAGHGPDVPVGAPADTGDAGAHPAAELDLGGSAGGSTAGSEPTPDPEAESEAGPLSATAVDGRPPLTRAEPLPDDTGPTPEPVEAAAQPEGTGPSVTAEGAEPSVTAEAALAAPQQAERPSPVEVAAVVTPAMLLSSRDPQERRRGLIELSAREPSDEELGQICGLLLDPDREVRLLAVQTLAGFPERVDDEAVRRAIQDPDDEVRAAGVRLAAHREPCEVSLIAPLLATRRHPRTQRTVMDLLPSVIPASGPSDQDVAAVALAVGEMAPGPNEEERVGLARLTHTLGTDRLIGALSLGEIERRGAVRLLQDETSPAVLRALAALVADPIEEIRAVAQLAADRIAPVETAAPEVSEPEAPPVELLSVVAARLGDLDPIERERAAEELGARDREEVLAWVLDGVTSGTPHEAELAALLAGRLGLHEAAGAVLDRSTGLPSQERRAFLDALREMRPDPGALVDGLASIEPIRRPQAVDLLWEICGPDLIDRVPDLLADASPPVRVAALDGLGGTADPRGTGAAEAALANDPSPAVRAAAVRALGRCMQGSPAEALERALADPDPDVRATALQALPASADPQTANLVSRSLADPDERVRRAAMHRFAVTVGADRQAAWAVLRSCSPRERGELVAALQETGSGLTELAFERMGSVDEEERVLAVDVVGWGGSPGCVEAAIHALADPSAPVRRSAVASLGRLREPSAAGALAKALVDPDPDVRIGAVGALGLIDDESVLGALVTALKDPEPRVREAASQVLTEWSSPAVARRLAGVLAVPSLRDSAADLLTRIGPASVELLIDVLRQGNPALSPIVGGLLGRIVGLDELLGRLNAPDPDRRLRAVEAVGAVGGASAVDALVRTLFDPDERIRVRSAQLLGTLGDPRAEPPVRQAALEDPVPEVIQAAKDALARLGAGDGGQAA
jgi:HEAT repeat protein